MIPQSTIDQIQDRADIVEVIGSYVQLRRAGQNFKGCCPFHNEKTPSFVVSPDKQIFHCFGCQVGGNVFSFLMKIEGVHFREAVQRLADRTGIEMPEDESEKKLRERLDPLYAANQFASDFFVKTLKLSQDESVVMKYLRKRGVAQELVDRFRVGYSPNQWDGLLKASGTSFQQETMLSAGLALKKQGGGVYDRFRNRLMFPIADSRGRIVGFGGRVLDDSLPKYVNTPETPVYHKGRVLYGIYEGSRAIKKDGYVIIVEGYMDVIGCHAAGVENAVSSSGTALTVDQIKLLKRLTSQIVMLFDSDAAGQSATLRGTDLLIAEGCTVKVAQMPSGHDPDSYVKEFGAENFRTQVLGAARSIFDYKYDLMKARFDPSKPEGKAAISEAMINTIRRVPNEVLKTSLISDLSKKIGVSEHALNKELEKTGAIRNSFRVQQKTEVKPQKPDAISPVEKLLLGLMSSFENVWNQSQDKPLEEFFGNTTAKNLYQRIIAHDSWDSARPSRLMNELLEDDAASFLLRECVREVETVTDAEKAFNDCLRHFDHKKNVERQATLRRQIAECDRRGDEETRRRLLQEFNEIVQRSR